jgi:Winged helix-turn helix
MPVIVAAALAVSDEDRVVLQRWARSTSEPHRGVVQARGLLLAADGVANEEIARRCETTPDTVRRWRARLAEKGVDGVGVIAPVGAASRGCPRASVWPRWCG